MTAPLTRIARALAAGALLFGALALPGTGVAPARAAEYTLETSATYDVEPESRRIGVTVEVRFTNTTPDPEGQFSVFDEVKLAVHDQAEDVAATDAEGDLTVAVAVENDVNVATVELRDQLRFEETAELTLTYTLSDGEDPTLRILPSLVIFSAWGFGTASDVRVEVPADFEVHVDGDRLTSAADGALVSGPITNPSQWVAVISAVGEPEYASSEGTVPLAGGTADIEVRALVGDEPWGERVLAIAEDSLPLLEEAIGLPYPGAGELVLTEAPPVGSARVEPPGSAGGTIMVALDQPPFTVVHQLAHVWLSDELVETRWIREGLASDLAARIAEGAQVDVPYDPTAVAEAQAAAAFPLDSWSADAGTAGETYGYARSWSVMAALRERVGTEAITEVLERAGAAVGPYSTAKVRAEPETAATETTPSALTTRSFLDHLEGVSGVDVTDLFRTYVLTAADTALLEQRAAARAAFDELIEASDGWGAPDPVAGAMTAWSFDDAMAQIDAARAWLADREELLDELARSGLSAPERLQQAYLAHGGGADAQAELNAEREVATSYASTAEAVNAERSFVEQMGLIGGPDPAQQLRLANGHFADGDLRGSLDALAEAQQLLSSAEASGIARLASLVLIAVVLLVVAIVLFRRRSAPQAT